MTLVLFRGVRNAPRLRIDATGGKIQAALLDPTLVSATLYKPCIYGGPFILTCRFIILPLHSPTWFCVACSTEVTQAGERSENEVTTPGIRSHSSKGVSLT